MTRASNVSVLQATAAIVSLAILFWSVGLPSLRLVEAANVATFSDTLSDSAPSVVANHTIEFVTPSGMAAGETISVTFPAGFTGIASIDDGDIDLAVNGVDEDLGAVTSGTTWGASSTAQVVNIQSGSDSIGAGATVTIEIGTNAAAGGAGVNQITNPATSTSYEIEVAVGSVDTGKTRVAIVDTVTVTAAVDTQFTFTVTGVAAGQTVNTADTTGGVTSPTAIPFGTLTDGNASTAAQDLTVQTNAANGFVVTVASDGQLVSGNGADIDSFADGNDDTVPAVWSPPSASLGSEETYGHWGVTSDDDTLTAGLTDFFNAGGGGDRFVAVLTTPTEVFRHNSPTDGTVTGEGTTRVGYKVEISAFQEAADDYQATLTYVATPVF